jgi:DNA-binding NarL/FixJ family response regulator
MATRVDFVLHTAVKSAPQGRQGYWLMELSAKSGCVLVADSHPAMLGAVRSLLEGMFESVVMVGDEASLLAAIPRLRPDLVVVDLSLPVAGQPYIVRRLGEKFPGLKMIVLSVHSETEAVRAVMCEGAAGFVLKRTAVTDLGEAVDAIRAGGVYVSPTVDFQS